MPWTLIPSATNLQILYTRRVPFLQHLPSRSSIRCSTTLCRHVAPWIRLLAPSRKNVVPFRPILSGWWNIRVPRLLRSHLRPSASLRGCLAARCYPPSRSLLSSAWVIRPSMLSRELVDLFCLPWFLLPIAEVMSLLTRCSVLALLTRTPSRANFPLREPSSDESSFDGPDISSPAQAYAKRQSCKTIRRCDGTEDFRPLTGASAMVNRDNLESPSAKFMAAGLPGFGDNETHGKILPCHRVKEDGLMRINSQTVSIAH